MAQAWYAPTLIAETQVSQETSTGIALSVVVPFPRFPYGLYPQHFTVPPVMRAQALPAPALTLVTQEVSHDT